MPWIKVRTELADDPTVVHAVLQLSRSTVTEVTPACVELSRQIVDLVTQLPAGEVMRCLLPLLPPETITSLAVGACVRMWSIADEQTTDGVLAGYTPAFLDRHLGVPEWTKIVADAPQDPWMIIKPNLLEFPEFDKHMSKSAKKRAMGQKRQETQRKAGKSPTKTTSPSDVTAVTGERDTRHAQSALEERRGEEIRVEERREDKGDDHLSSWTEEEESTTLALYHRHFSRRQISKVFGLKTLEGKNRSIADKVAYLVGSGRIPRNTIEEAIEAIRHHTGPIGNKFAYFHTVMDEHVQKKTYQNFGTLLAKVKIPTGWKAKTDEQEEQEA